MGCKAVGRMNIDINLKNCNATWSKIVEQKERDWLTISQKTDEVIATLKAGNEALQLALETERGAANLYARQVAHWIGKHDALLEQQLVQRIETLPDVEMALRVANEYGTKDSQIDSGNLYAALRQCLDYIAQPVQRLTDDEITDIARRLEAIDPSDKFWRDFARAIEAAALDCQP